MRSRIDSVICSVAMMTALTFSVVGFVTNIVGHGATHWFLFAAILALIAFGTVMDQHRLSNHAIDTVAASIFMALGMGFGAVGFILGLVGVGAAGWLFSAVILVLVGIGFLSELHRHSRGDVVGYLLETARVVLIVAALGTGVIGFLVSLGNGGHGNYWLSSGMILAVLSIAAMLQDDFRASSLSMVDRGGHSA